MNDFLTDLYNYISEHTLALQDDRDYQHALQAYMTLEEEVKEKTGGDLLYRYQCAEDAISRRRNIAVFAQTLRFSHRFMLEVLR